MNIRGGADAPLQLLIKQLDHIFFITADEKISIYKASEDVYRKLDYNFRHIGNKYYSLPTGIIFDMYHSGQYTMFLYEMSRRLAKDSANKVLCDKIYNLCKMLSSADIYYEIVFPDIYFFDHPQGSVMGRAEYSNYFFFSQNCTVGNNKGKYPRLGTHVYMMSGAKILGECRIGDRVILSANTYIKDCDIPSDSLVFGNWPNIIVKSLSRAKFEDITKNIFLETERRYMNA